MIKRNLDLPKILGKKTSAFLFGARGVGKTRLCLEALENYPHVLRIDLLESDTFARYLSRPALFAAEVSRAIKETKELLVFVDEIQRVPALLDEVHRLLELHKPQLRFLLTGSSARKLKRSGANLLAGRAVTLKLHPLSSLECEIDLEQALHIGTLPGILLDSEQPLLALKSYVATYIREEIQQEALVRRVDAFARFLELAGQYHGETINASEIGRAASLTAATILEYFQILEDTLLAWRLPGWNASVRKQMRTAPRLYLFDNGVANVLRGELGIPPREGTSRYGKLFESWVVQEFFRWNDYLQTDFKFSYWRTNSGSEVDLIVSRGAGQPLAAIEIKSGTQIDAKNLHGLQAFAEEYPKVPRFCACRTPLAYSLPQNIEVCPWQSALQLLKQL